MRLADPGRLKLGAKGRDEEPRQPPDLFDRNVEQLVGAWIGRMEILEEHKYGLPARQTNELAEKRLERLFLLALRREFQSRVPAIERHRQQLGQQLHITFRRSIRCDERLQFVEPSQRRVIALETRRPLQLGDERE